uniref:Uncharacterized protein n=1 Tax=Octopus bimaculoides TaxID=37653 RepID=A0A0L8FZ29_OCTBM
MSASMLDHWIYCLRILKYTDMLHQEEVGVWGLYSYTSNFVNRLKKTFMSDQ